MAVAGSSAGGLCAYLAAIHCVSPKPKGIVSMYGLGGNFLVSTNQTPYLKQYIYSDTSRLQVRIISNQRPRYFFEDETS